MYVCGPTVQSSPAHRPPAQRARLRPWRAGSRYRGYDVTFVRNVTDIDDKILANASRRPSSGGRSPTGSSSSSPPATTRSASCRRPTSRARPRASPQMQEHHRAPHRTRARLRGPRRLGRRLLRHGELAGLRRAHPAEAATTWRPRPTPTRAASATRATSPSGRAPSPTSRESASWPSPVGRRAPGLAHRVLGDVDALPRRRRSTSTAADSTCASRTTRTSSPSRPPPATRFATLLGAQRARRTSTGRRCRSRSATRSTPPSCSALARPLVVRYFLGGAHYRSTHRLPRRLARRGRGGARPHRGFLERVERAARRHPVLGRRQPGHPRRLRRRRWTTTSACRRRSPCCTTPCAPATPRSTTKTSHDAAVAHGRGRRDDRGARHRPAATRTGRRGDAGPATSRARRPRRRASSKTAHAARAAKDFAAADRIRAELAAAGITIEDSHDRHALELGIMKGSSGKPRAGAVRKAKKGKQVGSGGQGRQALEGKGPTPKAEDRTYHPAGKRKAAQDRLRGRRRQARRRAGCRPRGRAPRRVGCGAALEVGRRVRDRHRPQLGRRGAAREASPRRRSTSPPASRWTTASKRR